MAKEITGRIVKSEDEFKFLAAEMIANMREADVIDFASYKADPLVSLVESYEASEETRAYFGEDGKLLLFIGITPCVIDHVGRNIWMCGTKELNNGYVKDVLFRRAKLLINEWLEQYHVLQNIVYEKNVTSAKYLAKTFGAIFLPFALVVNGERYRQFVILSDYIKGR